MKYLLLIISIIFFYIGFYLFFNQATLESEFIACSILLVSAVISLGASAIVEKLDMLVKINKKD